MDGKIIDQQIDLRGMGFLGLLIDVDRMGIEVDLVLLAFGFAIDRDFEGVDVGFESGRDGGDDLIEELVLEG